MRFEWHEYDIEVSQLRNAILKSVDAPKVEKENFNRQEYLDSFEILLQTYCEEYKIDYQKKQVKTIVKSSSNLYGSFLSYALGHYETPKLKLFLDYQKKLFKGNYYAHKNNFSGLVEFLCYREVKSISLDDTLVRLISIMDWVREERRSVTSYDKTNTNRLVLRWTDTAPVLRMISVELNEMGYTKRKLDFQNAFYDNKVCNWCKDIPFLILLIDSLADKEPPSITTSKNTRKGIFLEAEKVFRDRSVKTSVARTISFKHRKSRLSESERLKTNKLVSDFLGRFKR